MKKYIGCDLGGTNMRAAIVDVEDGSMVYQMSIPTQARDGHDAVMRRMAGLFLQMIERAGFALGIAAANICVSVGPRRIILDGGVSQAGDLLLIPIRPTLRERVTVMPVEQVEVVQSQLGNHAGVIGAECWAAKSP